MTRRVSPNSLRLPRAAITIWFFPTSPSLTNAARSDRTTRLCESHARAVADAERVSVAQALLRGQFTLTSSNLMMRKSAFEAIGPFRPFRYCHDWDFLLRAIGRTQIGWLREPLLRYRLHGANTIRKPDPWLYLTEKGLIYASFLADASAGEVVQHSGYVLEFARILSVRRELADERIPPARVAVDVLGARSRRPASAAARRVRAAS